MVTPENTGVNDSFRKPPGIYSVVVIGKTNQYYISKTAG